MSETTPWAGSLSSVAWPKWAGHIRGDPCLVPHSMMGHSTPDTAPQKTQHLKTLRAKMNKEVVEKWERKKSRSIYTQRKEAELETRGQ